MHDFQRAFALAMLRNGTDMYTLAKLMGREGITILQRYFKQTHQDTEAAPRRAGPVDHSALLIMVWQELTYFVWVLINSSRSCRRTRVVRSKWIERISPCCINLYAFVLLTPKIWATSPAFRILSGLEGAMVATGE